MKKTIIFITAMLILFPMGVLVYKARVLKLSLVPQMVDDVWNLHINVKPKGDVTSFSFPIPKMGLGQKVSDERIRRKDLEVFIDSNSDSHVATWTSKELIKGRISYSARVDLKPVIYKRIPKDYTETYPKGLEQYLKLPALLPEDEEAISSLETAILEGSEDKTTLIRKIYYYVEEEIQRNTDIKTIHETLNTGKGSPLIKAKLFNIMARRKNVPSRIVVMVRMPEVRQSMEETKLRFTFANEVFLANKWVPIDTNRGYFAQRPDNFMLIHRNYEEVEKLISKKNITYSIQAERARINRYNKTEFKKEVIKSDSIFSKLSLYRLPLPLQTMFTTILLIPIGALVLSIARNIIGIPTFGIFTPILLTLFFKETSFGFGMLFFAVVVTIGIIERYILDKFYLLAVPRLSIILTLIIMLMLGYSFYAVELTSISQKHLSFFPIVIVTLIIERLSIMITEEGMLNTFKTLLGTLLIVLLVYSLYFISALEMFMFTNPELLLTIIGLLILVGKYKGYRLSEFLRFRDLVRQKKKMESLPHDLL
jgi:hypothetical protein